MAVLGAKVPDVIDLLFVLHPVRERSAGDNGDFIGNHKDAAE